MNKTPIDWVQNPDGSPGYSWNPITGCLNGCEYCYARKLANGRVKSTYLKNTDYAYDEWGNLFNGRSLVDAHYNPFYPRFWPGRMLDPRDSSRGKGVFVCNMSDLFGIGIPEEWTQRILREIRICHDNRFYLLTKQPQNLIKFSPFPDNCFVGVSVTNNSQVTPAFEGLSNIDAKIKYLSLEPLLERMGERNRVLISQEFMMWFDWIIIGAQTKPTIMPKTEWVKEIVGAADKAGIPVFLKDSLGPLLQPYLELPKWARTPHSLVKLRQEMPV